LIALAPGAALFAIGVAALHIATIVWFPHHLQGKSDVYGTLGVSLALLLWAYLIGRVITLAAVLNAALWNRFGPQSAHALYERLSSWHVPVIGDQHDRFWRVLFSTDADPSGPDSNP